MLILEINQIYCGDCLELMKDISDCSIDMILCDPPFQITQNKWDSQINLSSMWQEYNRIRKPNTPIVLMCQQPFTSVLVMSNSKEFKYDWTWKKPKGTGHLNAKRQPLRDKEDIAVFYKFQCTYNPQFGNGEPYKNKAGKDHTKATSMTDSYGNYTNFRYDNHGKRYPKQVLEFPVVERNTVHPTQKPVVLFEYLIKTYTNEGDLVLDNCIGSGTTAVAARNLGRNFIGIEMSPEYCEVARKRLEQSP